MPYTGLRISSGSVRNPLSTPEKARLISARADFLAGQLFDIRLEVHAPVNGSEATENTTPDPNFEFTIAREGEEAQSAAEYFQIDEPELENWNFTWFEGKMSLRRSAFMWD